MVDRAIQSAALTALALQRINMAAAAARQAKMPRDDFLKAVGEAFDGAYDPYGRTTAQAEAVSLSLKIDVVTPWPEDQNK